MTQDNPLPKLLTQPRFLIAAHSPAQWPTDKGAEIAFAGRSNVGKSSAINAITQRKNLARTSRTPGRTQQIVFFELNERQRMVDLPGYGFAKVPAELRRHWGRIIERYLTTRRSLRGLVLLMDSRHPLTELDQQMLQRCASANLAVYLLLTKIDKLSRGQATVTLRTVKDTAAQLGCVGVQPFSAHNHTGVEQTRQRIVDWLEPQ